MRKVSGAIASIAAAVATVIAIWTAPRSFWDWWWPGPLLVLVLLAAVGEAIYIAIVSRAPSVQSSHDQTNLDKILSTLPRETVNEWRDTDLLGGWLLYITRDLGRFVRLSESEDHFLDPALEARRRTLLATARHLSSLDSHYGIPAAMNGDRWRDFGYSSGTLDSMIHTEAGQQVQREAREMVIAAEAMVAAYEELVDTARRSGYDISATRGISPARVVLES
jgi:hypothetical protein